MSPSPIHRVPVSGSSTTNTQIQSKPYTDAWSWDAPFIHTAKRYVQTGDSELIWEGHKAGRDIGYTHIEKLQNLERLPSSGFLVSCFPVKIKAASAGWCRVVAIFED